MSDNGSDRQTFSTGVVRSKDANGVRYDLITPIGLRQLAETYAEGAAKYGDNNWLKGFPASDLLNHAMRHIELWRAGDASEPHLAHAAWNLFTLMHFEETRPDLIDLPSRQPKSATPAAEKAPNNDNRQVGAPLAYYRQPTFAGEDATSESPAGVFEGARVEHRSSKRKGVVTLRVAYRAHVRMDDDGEETTFDVDDLRLLSRGELPAETVES